MIGNNVMRVEVEGTQERLVAAVATAQAGYTTATEDGARNGESLKSQHPPVADSRNWTIGFGSFSVVPLRLPGTGVNLTARLQKLAADVSGAWFWQVFICPMIAFN
jgi:hypothetical protein